MNAHEATFSVGDALRFGWERTKANLQPLLVFGVVNAVLALANPGPERSVVGTIAVELAQFAVGLAFLRVLLQLHDGQTVNLDRPGPLLRGYWQYVMASLLLGGLVGLGLVLFIFPGVIWGLRYGLAPILVADKGLDAGAAFRESSRLTEGVRGELFVFVLAAIGVNLLGALALGVGLLLTLPTTGLAALSIYRQLQARAGARPEAPFSSGPVSPLAAS